MAYRYSSTASRRGVDSACNSAWGTTGSSVSKSTTAAPAMCVYRLRRPKRPAGRGLVLVATPAAKWGVEERNPGKAVWCEISL